MSSFTAYIAIVTALLLSRSMAVCPNEIKLIVGSRTTTKSPTVPGGVGITLLSIKEDNLRIDGTIGVPLVGNDPSYIAYSRPYFYFVNGGTGFVRELGFSSRFPYITTQSADASDGSGAYVSVVSTPSTGRRSGETNLSQGLGLRRVVVTADYLGGSVSTYIRTRSYFEPVDVFKVPVGLAAKTRDSSLSNQQAVPHPHMALPYKRGVIVPDLGSDIVFYLGVSRNGQLSELSRLRFLPGDGPRHAAVHPRSDTVYVVNEISLSVVVLRTGKSLLDSTFSVQDRVDLIGETTGEEPVKAAAIRVSEDGKFLYTSVRFPGTILGKIVGFSLNPSTGDITGKIGEWSSHGIHPRDFYIVEHVQFLDNCSSFLVIANRDSDNVVLLARDLVTGKLGDEPVAKSTVHVPTSVLAFD